MPKKVVTSLIFSHLDTPLQAVVVVVVGVIFLFLAEIAPKMGKMVVENENQNFNQLHFLLLQLLQLKLNFNKSQYSTAFGCCNNFLKPP